MTEITDKKYYHKLGSIAQINAYLKRIGLEGFCLDTELNNWNEVSIDYYDYDGCVGKFNEGASISFGIYKNDYEVFVTKYRILEEV